MRRTLAPLMMTLAVLVAWGTVLFVFYPGGMSVDSRSILIQARDFRFSDHHPPAFALMWHLLDRVIPGPFGIMAANTALLLGSLAAVFALSRARPGWFPDSVLFLGIALFPAVFGILGVVWIDNAMAAFLLLSLAFGIAARRAPLGTRRQYILSAAALLALTWAVAQRHNALPGALALIVLLISPYVYGTVRQRLVRAVVGYVFSLAVILAGTGLVSRLLVTDKVHLWQVVAMYDLAGISARTGVLLVPEAIRAGGQLDDIVTLYTPRSYTPLIVGQQIHSSLSPQPSARSLRFTSDPEELAQLKRAWFSAVVTYPWTYVRHRAAVFAELVNISSRQIWTPVYDGIVPNELGITPRGNDANHPYLRELSALAVRGDLFRPFVYLILALLLVPAVLVAGGPNRFLLLVILASVFLHAAGLFVGVASGDFRYSNWILIGSLLTGAILIRDGINRWRMDMSASDATLPQAPQGLGALLFTCFRYRSLMFQLAWREIQNRYRGSVLGSVWTFATPLILLGVYSFVFSLVFRPRWGDLPPGGGFALVLFSGLILVSLFNEALLRAPTLLIEHATYIKKVVFPLEILPGVVVLAATFNALVSLLVFAVFYPFVFGLPPLTALFLPVILIPLLLTALGVVFFFSALGIFLRDIRHVLGVIATVIMFLSPVFYPVTAVPEAYRALLYINPLAFLLEASKLVLFEGVRPSTAYLGLSFVSSIVVLQLGYWWFVRTRKGFADVV